MPYCMLAENRHAGADAFERINQQIRSTGAFPAEGQLLLIAGPGEAGWRAISVWDSREAQERFVTERLRPACAHAGVDFDDVTHSVFEVHTLVAGDLTGALQPA